MKHPTRVEDYLQHIAEAIDRVASYIQEIDNPAALERDHKTQAAVIRYIEIIGEAANRIQKQAPDFVAAHPSLPWHEMRGMRNRMIHNYFDVNINVLWGTVKDDLPKLKEQIDALLLEWKQDPGCKR
ncbi:MAG: DUF86 domain-containing protein [Acidobacteriaceae bacterium]|nr:DUF86 domain-containing protein [Acidobacteriaceae bacterium]MBV9305179.1 DUF86 domain-containing protein [Acidobacteriaceae bacterium]